MYPQDRKNNAERRARLARFVLYLFPNIMRCSLSHLIRKKGLSNKYCNNKRNPPVLTPTELLLIKELPKVENFTIQLCYKLISFEELLPTPSHGWGKFPDSKAVKVEDDIERIRHAINEIVLINNDECTENYLVKFLYKLERIIHRFQIALGNTSFITIYNCLLIQDIDTAVVLKEFKNVGFIDSDVRHIKLQDRERYSKISAVVAEFFPKILRNMIPPSVTPSMLYTHCTKPSYKWNKSQQLQIQQLKSSQKYESLNASMLYQLFRIFSLVPTPTQGWGKEPTPCDLNTGDDIERIRLMRNKIIDRCDTCIDQTEFDNFFLHFREITQRIAVDYEHELTAIAEDSIESKRKSELEFPLQELQDIKDVTEETVDMESSQLIPVDKIVENKKEGTVVSGQLDKEWFYKLSIVCDGFMVDCIIDKRLQSSYKVLEKITKKKELSIISDNIHSEVDLTISYLSSSIEFEKLFIFHKMRPIRQMHIKDELHNSIEANQINLCRYILMKSNKSVLFPLLEKALDKAIWTKCRNTIKAVTSQIIKEFFQMHKNVLDKKTSIWLGIECACKTTKDESYEDCRCFSSKPKIIIERYQSDFEDTSVDQMFTGFPIRIIDLMESNSTEASIVANEILENSETQLIEGNVSGKVAEELFKNHRKLSIIYPSSMKSKGFKNPGSHKLEKLDCINLVCSVKGVIPVGETHFPLEIEGVQTDVLEGTSHLLGNLRIGDVVENTNTQSTGTLGGFVKYYGLNTFLTCAHVVFGVDNVHSITKDDIHLKNCHKMKDNNVSAVTECILIRHQFKHNNHDPSETSIDAALALIETGDMSKINIARDDPNRHCCSGLGLSSPYLNHNAIDPVTLRYAKAFCGYSGNQISDLKTSKKNVLVRMPSHLQSGDITMFNQLCLYGMQFQPGDSGTCVYVDTTAIFSRQTGCIGMLIGQSTCGHFVLTPMHEILKAFDL